MFIVRNGRRIPYLFAPDEPAGGGDLDFDAAMDAAAGDADANAAHAQRSTGAAGDDLDDEPAGGQQARTAGGGRPDDAAGAALPDEAAVRDDMPYKDAAGLRADIARARERYGPVVDALSGMSAEDQAEALKALPNMTAEARTLLGTLGGMHPDDARAIQQAVVALGDGTATRADTADFFRNAADILSGEQVAGDSGQWDGGEAFADLPADAPVTKADLDAWGAQRDAQEAERRATEEIRDEIRDLGYDPDSSNPLKRADVAALVEIARSRPDGSLAEAHKVRETQRQQIIDDYVAGKTADASRAPAPNNGSSSSQERPVETMEQAEQAAQARLDAALGPSRR